MPSFKRWWDVKIKGGYNDFKQHRISLPPQDLLGQAHTADHSAARALNVMYCSPLPLVQSIACIFCQSLLFGNTCLCRHLAGRDDDGSQIVVFNNCITDELDEISPPSLRTRLWDNLLLYFLFLIDSLDETGSKNFVVLYMHKPG